MDKLKGRHPQKRANKRSEMPNSVDVSLEYKGPGVQGGSMDGRIVAQEILGFCDFASLAGRAAFGRDIDVQSEIRGFRGESFDIDFALGIVGPTATLLSLHASSPKDILILIRESINLWKHLMGSKPKETVRVERNHNQVQVTNAVGTVQVVNIETLNFVADPAASQAAQDFLVKPLEKAGVKTVDIVSKQMRGRVASVSANEVPYFVALDMDRPLLESQHDTGLIIDSPNFREGNKWRFYDGQASFMASMEDEDFLRRVDNGIERFGKGDVLVVTMRVRQVRTADGGLRAERSVVKVKEHREAQKQYSLVDR